MTPLEVAQVVGVLSSFVLALAQAKLHLSTRKLVKQMHAEAAGAEVDVIGKSATAAGNWAERYDELAEDVVEQRRRSQRELQELREAFRAENDHLRSSHSHLQAQFAVEVRRANEFEAHKENCDRELADLRRRVDAMGGFGTSGSMIAVLGGMAFLSSMGVCWL